MSLALYPSAYRHGSVLRLRDEVAAVNGAVHIPQKFGVKHFKLSLHIFNALLHGGKGVVKGVAVKFFYNIGNVNVTLLGGIHILKLGLAFRKLVVSKHDNIAGVKLSGVFHLSLKSTAVKIGYGSKALSSERCAKLLGLYAAVSPMGAT